MHWRSVFLAQRSFKSTFLVAFAFKLEQPFARARVRRSTLHPSSFNQILTKILSTPPEYGSVLHRNIISSSSPFLLAIFLDVLSVILPGDLVIFLFRTQVVDSSNAATRTLSGRRSDALALLHSIRSYESRIF
ncbi:hypothetical protein LshimejAT787_1301470 [Lyophyllum shimeji]|uniref:Uncharacterized protein n=1 Tax=Lyophyllum shimeji TaxID=47721 RepID=A0A9P3PY18_LYOSH|nr:hypothetical protein LshimejAT787_1301470 [Lyophyllum shimeji]